jgi:hypothetical protein
VVYFTNERRARMDKLDPTKYPTLYSLIEQGLVWLDENNEYVGRASDGIEVSIGSIHDRERCERYLKDRPSPDRW